MKTLFKKIGSKLMETLKKIYKVFTENIIESLITIGSFFIFIGVFIIYKPLAFIVLGLISMLLALIIYKAQ